MSDPLRASLGEEWNPERHNNLVKLAQSNTLIPGRGVRMKRTSLGTVVTYTGGDGGGFASPIFRVTVARKGENFEVTFAGGLIGGIKPMLAGEELGRKGKSGKLPALPVGAADFNGEGICGLYLRCSLDKSFAVTAVTPIARPVKPPKEAWIANKLTGFLIREGTAVRYDRQLFSNLGFYAANRKANGFCDPLFFWAS